MTITLFDLLGDQDRRYSQYCWRAKLALKHKGLEFEVVPLTLTDKSPISFSEATSVPVLVDREVVKTDSWEIATYLDETYGGASSLLGGEIGAGVTRIINSWADRTVNIALGPLIARDIIDATHMDDRAYLRATLEDLYKKTLEEVQEGREGRVKAFYRILDPIRTTFRKGQKFIGGEGPSYADYVLFSQFQWARVVSPFKLLDEKDPVFAWRERMLDLYDGYARNIVCHEIAL
ncbi:MAG: glutathione S-transferase N-terminal domain-containing protein [Pseudomonadota bacterium]|nr:glutathione S-transferase N-terminal domain-containing protein [Pseudomonadota bacterium]